MDLEKLKKETFHGGLWLTVGTGVEQGLRFLRNVILTRILAPEAFGLMAIVLAINAAFESFSEVGIKQAIIQNPKGETQSFLNGAWWFSFIRATGLYVLGYLGAPFIAQFYEDPTLTPLVRVAFLAIPLKGLMSPRAFVAMKEMKFVKWMSIEQGGGVIGILTSLFLAFWLENVWALVIGFTVESAARFVLSYFICPFFPNFHFEKALLRSLLKYARGIFGLPILTFVFMRTDIFVVGKICTSAELGLYSMGVTLARMPFLMFNNLMNKLMMPVFSKLQEDKLRINRATLGMTLMICLLGFPSLFFLILYGRKVLSVTYGSSYGVVAIPFAIAFATELLRSSSIPIATYFLMSGRPELHRLFTAIRAAFVVLLIYPAVKTFGLTGAASAALLAMVAGYVLQTQRMSRITGMRIRTYCGLFGKSIVISIPVPFLWFLSHYVSDVPIVNIGAGVVGIAISFTLGAVLFFRSSDLMTFPNVFARKQKGSISGSFRHPV